MIQSYFNRIKSLVDRYANMPFVLDVALSFESRPGDQGYLTGELLFVDGSRQRGSLPVFQAFEKAVVAVALLVSHGELIIVIIKIPHIRIALTQVSKP